MSSYTTAEDVRHFIFDRSVDDNPLEMDIFFSDDEIKKAMRFAAMSINSIPPRVFEVSPDRLPLHPMSLHLTVYHLYLAKISMLSRNDIDYSVGEVNASEVKRQISNLKELMMLHKQEGEREAARIKAEKNINDAYQIFC